MNVRCKDCGEKLDSNVQPDSITDELILRVSPCTSCMKDQYDDGYSDGLYGREEDE
jgi:hypothetical protein